jgi:hypothetical protein
MSQDEQSVKSGELKRYKVSGHYSDGECDNGEWSKFAEAEAALAERDSKIRELEATVERLKNCWNCDKAEARCHYFEGPVCERWGEQL